MSNLNALHELTIKLYDHLTLPLPTNDDDRDQYIEKVDRYLERRELRLSSLHQVERNKKTMIVAKEIMDMNNKIDMKLQEVRSVIGRDLHRVRAQKQINDQYEGTTPSQQPMTSYYFDQKN
ncbi:hypothetical protein [Geomicrobium sp. JCM 19038]|uniref:hypothetical protein n=1 Tax=Geomicrobium sp. JCM 19038 TaxID=1460635 RepID=UPI00045F22F8|nr:hypothetical protein [Geomicrobium sp. JCM 19038]GAK07229.1 hypothetical protein JCM19038_951 [Geomicrobium sp. JCM 19038]